MGVKHMAANSKRARVARMFASAALALCALGLAHGTAHAQEPAFPSRPIRFVVGFAAGGGVDVVARLFADKLPPLIGQPVVVENRGGAAGTIAARQVLAAEPDGYTILVNSNPMLINQVMNPGLGLDIERDLRPIASIAPQSVIIVAAPDLPVASLDQLIALARGRKLNYGTPGAGSVSHLAVEYLFTSLSGARMEHIPFTGAAPALTAAVASQIEVASTTMPPAVALVNSAKLKGIAVTSATRSAVLPQVPTVSEAGLQGLPVTAWTGLFVRARTPDAPVGRLTEAVLRVAEMPEVKARLAQLGFEPTTIAGDQFGRDCQPSSRCGPRWWKRRRSSCHRAVEPAAGAGHPCSSATSLARCNRSHGWRRSSSSIRRALFSRTSVWRRDDCAAAIGQLPYRRASCRGMCARGRCPPCRGRII